MGGMGTMPAVVRHGQHSRSAVKETPRRQVAAECLGGKKAGQNRPNQ
jgi:hypothetical protein